MDDCGDRGGYITATNCTFVLIGGNMGITEATPRLTGQKYLNITASSSGGGYPGGGGSSGGLSTAQSGFTIKNSSGEVIMNFKYPTVSTGQSGFEDTTAGAKPGPGGSSGTVRLSTRSKSCPMRPNGVRINGQKITATRTVSTVTRPVPRRVRPLVRLISPCRDTSRKRQKASTARHSNSSNAKTPSLLSADVSVTAVARTLEIGRAHV